MLKNLTVCTCVHVLLVSPRPRSLQQPAETYNLQKRFFLLIFSLYKFCSHLPTILTPTACTRLFKSWVGWKFWTFLDSFASLMLNEKGSFLHYLFLFLIWCISAFFFSPVVCCCCWAGIALLFTGCVNFWTQLTEVMHCSGCSSFFCILDLVSVCGFL